MRTFILLFSIFYSIDLLGQEEFITPYEKDPQSTATYAQTIAYFENLATAYDNLSLQSFGTTDSGYPLHLAILSNDGDTDPSNIRAKGKLILFVNNAIHSGEPCGVDATMLLMRDYLQKESLQSYLEKVVIIAIPFYNIGGGLNRGSYSRANQNGPKAYGFRGNAKNLDLNRDFIKCDSKNAQSFNQIFNLWQPDVFIDNHTTNGADYSYSMTLIASQKDKLDPHLSAYQEDSLLPQLYEQMRERKWEMTPYVNVRSTPDEGIAGFLDLPRYSSGYAALHHTFSFIAEAHMLKPYPNRVQSCYHLMDALIQVIYKDGDKIKAARKKAIQSHLEKINFDINWSLDFEQKELLNFKGYEAKYKPSEITGLDRLYYDRSAPYEKEVPFFNTYTTSLSVEKPIAYIIPQAYDDVVQRLQWNRVNMERLNRDTILQVEMYYIKDFKTRNAYEGHYLHYNTTIDKKIMNWEYRKGDWIVYTNQFSNRYIVETLEPQAPDSWFSWNFFDGILMQKEYFSSYVFEDTALEYLDEHPEIKEALEQKKKEDEDFAKNARAQLDFIYKRSPYYEATHRLYPVGRLVKK